MDYRVIQYIIDSIVAENDGKARIQTAWEFAMLFPRYGICFVYVVLDLIGRNRCHFIMNCILVYYYLIQIILYIIYGCIIHIQIQNVPCI